MTQWTPASTSRRADMPVAEGELDADLAKLVRRTSVVRQGFYIVVLLVALAGQVSGAVEALHIPLAAAIPAVCALELGGIVVLANADVRRRLGERAVASRLLSVAIAAGAVTFNWLAHTNHLLGGFFAGMSALGYLVWLMHTENQRRDRLRIKGDLPPTTPAYELTGHWLRHPWLTMRARALAKADPRLGLYDSLASARAEVRREHRQAAIAKVLHRKIRAAVDPRTADIAIAVYDLDEIASRLAEHADYDGLTALIAADLAPARLAPNGVLHAAVPAKRRERSEPPTRRDDPEMYVAPRAIESDTAELWLDTLPQQVRSPEADQTIPAPRNGVSAPQNGVEAPSRMNGSEPIPSASRRRRRTASSDELTLSAAASEAEQARRQGAEESPSSLFSDLRRDLSHLQPGQRDRGRASVPTEEAVAETTTDISLRRRVHDALDAHVLPDDQRDDTELVSYVFDLLGLTDLERLSAQSYVRSWFLETRTGERIRSA